MNNPPQIIEKNYQPGGRQNPGFSRDVSGSFERTENALDGPLELKDMDRLNNRLWKVNTLLEALKSIRLIAYPDCLDRPKYACKFDEMHPYHLMFWTVDRPKPHLHNNYFPRGGIRLNLYGIIKLDREPSSIIGV